MDNRRMCANCRAFITTNDKVCPYCDMPVGPRAIDRQMAADAMAGMIQGDRFITGVLLLLNVGLAVATMMTPNGQVLYAVGQKDTEAIVRGLQWWRLITAGFLHGGLLHIAVNVYSLYGLGPQVDAVFGGYRYLVIWFVSTVAGFAASAWWLPYTPSVGASAGISGLVGAMVGLGVKEKHSAIGREASRYVPVAVILLAQGLLLPLPIDNAAHIGGFIGGFVVAYLAGSRGHARGDDSVWKTAAWVSVAVTAYAFFRMAEQLLARQ